MQDGRSAVDAVVSLTGFSLVGGPAYNDAKAAEDMLAQLDVPYLAAHPVEFQTLRAMGRDRTAACCRWRAPSWWRSPNSTARPGRWSSAAARTAPGRPAPAASAPVRSRTSESGGDDAGLQRARGHAGGAGRASGRAAPRRAQRPQGRDRAVQFPAECRQHRHGRLPLRLRVAASHAAARCSARAIRSKCPPASMRCASASSAAMRARFGADANVHARIAGRRPCAPRALAARDRGAMGPGARQAAERRQLDLRARRALRQCLRRRPARLRLRRRSDAAAVREGLRADACLLGLLSLAARGFRRRTRCCISAPTARWNSCRASRRACPARAGRTG